jgi:NAD(P)-dependent dehydrogenase (short-subunit alcohol dehydrogenase family)
MGRVTGKVAIVTGAAAAGGLGFATARVLAREGAKVVLTDLDEAQVKHRAQELNAAGGQATAARLDVTNEDDWCKAIALTVERYGALDILVNNAGVIFPAPAHEMTLESWNHVIDINLMGTFLGCKHAVTRMKQQGKGGSLVNVASISSLLGFVGSAAYCSSKGGVRSLSKVVALEGAPEAIRCNSVYPGLILTDLFKKKRQETPQLTEALAAKVPLGRIGEPDDIANAILFLASDESKYITGSEIIVDGGLVAQ